jgi:hypothetical protein
MVEMSKVKKSCFKNDQWPPRGFNWTHKLSKAANSRFGWEIQQRHKDAEKKGKSWRWKTQ